jgi:drug/metabolite transporter (DMT)-like permease
LPEPAGLPPQPWRAALLMAAAMLCFTCLDAILKSLVATHGLGMLVTVRNLVQVLLLAALAPLFGVGTLRTRRYGFHLVRGACIAASTFLIVLALARLPMAQTYAITFSAPLMATLLAAIALDERPRPAQWGLIAAGFAGVLVALEPGAPSFGPVLLLPLGMAAANAVFHVLTRYGGRDEQALTLVFWGSAAALFWCLLGLPLFFERLPAGAIGLLVVAGTLGTLAHLFIAAAFRRAPTATVSPILYTQIIWAALVGYLAFGETPSAAALLGGGIVAASGIALVRLSAAR